MTCCSYLSISIRNAEKSCDVLVTSFWIFCINSSRKLTISAWSFAANSSASFWYSARNFYVNCEDILEVISAANLTFSALKLQFNVSTAVAISAVKLLTTSNNNTCNYLVDMVTFSGSLTALRSVLPSCLADRAGANAATPSSVEVYASTPTSLHLSYLLDFHSHQPLMQEMSGFSNSAQPFCSTILYTYRHTKFTMYITCDFL